jgi:integrase
MAVIRLKYVNGFTNRDRRDGRVRYYFRRRGEKAISLPGVPGSEEFMAAYAMALAAQLEQIEIGAGRTLPGTINALIVDYYSSAEWNALSEDTRKTRRRIIERFRVKHGDKRVALLRREHIEKMLAQIFKLSSKRHWLKAIRGLLRFAVPTMLRVDPTDGIAAIKLRRTRGHHSWTDDEIAQYRAYWGLGTQQRLVMEFALETASRRGEVVRLGPQHVKNGRIRIERTHGSDDVDIPISPELLAACDAMPKSHLTYIVSSHGTALQIRTRQ